LWRRSARWATRGRYPRAGDALVQHGTPPQRHTLRQLPRSTRRSRRRHSGTTHLTRTASAVVTALCERPERLGSAASDPVTDFSVQLHGVKQFLIVAPDDAARAWPDHVDGTSVSVPRSHGPASGQLTPSQLGLLAARIDRFIWWPLTSVGGTLISLRHEAVAAGVFQGHSPPPPRPRDTISAQK
jgi:hypothetical protein